MGVGGFRPGSMLSKYVIVHDVQQHSSAHTEDTTADVTKPLRIDINFY